MKIQGSRNELCRSLIRRLKLFQPSPSLYDGIAGFNEYGPYGATFVSGLVGCMRDAFRMEGFWEVQSPIISPPDVWRASGHLERFGDIIGESEGKIFRVDKLIESEFPDAILDSRSKEGLIKFAQENRLTPPRHKEPLHSFREYSLMLMTKVSDAPAVLRPETATATYLQFLDAYQILRKRMPVKLFQIGKAFRNEVTTRQGLIRAREFEQAEAQLFVHEDQKNDATIFPDLDAVGFRFWSEAMQRSGADPAVHTPGEALRLGLLQHRSYAYCFSVVISLLSRLGFKPEHGRLRQHWRDEMAHYAADAWDIEIYTEEYGWLEICGVHDRGIYDLSSHEQASGKRLAVPNSRQEREIPQVLEIAFGVGRTFYSILETSVTERDNKLVLKIPRALTAFDVAVFPLVNRDGLPELGQGIVSDLGRQGFVCTLDSKGSIGKRYARMDEIGTLSCVTIDKQTKADGTVTVRSRDTAQQERIAIDQLAEYLT